MTDAGDARRKIRDNYSKTLFNFKKHSEFWCLNNTQDLKKHYKSTQDVSEQGVHEGVLNSFTT